MEKKKSAGQIVEESRLKQDQPIAPMEFVKEGQFADFAQNMEKIIAHGKKLFEGDFYIEKRIKREWPLDGAMHPFMMARKTCPTPDYSQSAMKFHRQDEAIEHLWTLPSKAVAQRYINNPLSLKSKEQKQMLNYIYDLNSGELLHKAKKMNGEIDKKIMMTVN